MPVDQAIRRQSIGASDAPKVILGPQFPMWAEKTGIAEPPDLDEVEAVQWGHILESVIAETFARRTGRVVEHNAEAESVRHPEYPFLTATLDATQGDPVKGCGALEIKNVGFYLAKDWEGDTPLKVQIQLQHQLAVTGLEWGTLCALIGGNRMVWYDMDRNDEFIEAMIAKEAKFWQSVQGGIPPSPDGSIATAECLKKLYPQNTGATVDLPAEAGAWDRQLIVSKQQIKVWEDRKREDENQLKAALGDATTGRLPNGDCYTWIREPHHVEAKEAYDSPRRVLRRKSK